MNKIGLRYINRLAKANNKEKAGDWFAASSYVSEALLSSLPGYLSRLVFNPSPHMMIIITMGDKTNGKAEDASSIVFDIDCILEQPMTMDENALMKALDELHNKAWAIFSSSMTPRLEKLLKEGRA